MSKAYLKKQIDFVSSSFYLFVHTVSPLVPKEWYYFFYITRGVEGYE